MQYHARSCPQAAPGKPVDPYVAQTLEWAGAMREFAISSFGGGLSRSEVDPLDQSVLNRDEPSKELFARGVRDVRGKGEMLGQRMAATSNAAGKAAIARDRGRLTYYTSFNFDAAGQYLFTKLSR